MGFIATWTPPPLLGGPRDSRGFVATSDFVLTLRTLKTAVVMQPFCPLVGPRHWRGYEATLIQSPTLGTPKVAGVCTHLAQILTLFAQDKKKQSARIPNTFPNFLQGFSIFPSSPLFLRLHVHLFPTDLPFWPPQPFGNIDCNIWGLGVLLQAQGVKGVKRKVRALHWLSCASLSACPLCCSFTGAQVKLHISFTGLLSLSNASALWSSCCFDHF